MLCWHALLTNQVSLLTAPMQQVTALLSCAHDIVLGQLVAWNCVIEENGFSKCPGAMLSCTAEQQSNREVCCCCRPVCLWVLLLLLPDAQRHVRFHADVLLLWVHVYGLLCLLSYAGCSRLQIIPHFCTAYLQVSNCKKGCTSVSFTIHVSLMCHLLSQMDPCRQGLCAISREKSVSCHDHIAGCM